MNEMVRRLKLNRLHLGILVGLGALALFLLTGGLQALGRLGAEHLDGTQQILFNPDDVARVDWQVGSVRKILTRTEDGWKDGDPAAPSPSGAPSVARPEQIQKLLIALATAASQRGAFAPFNKISGALSMSDGSVRRFKWNGSIFKWTDGPQADTGGVPGPLLERVLESGEFVSTVPHVSWCKSRVKEVRVESESLNFVVRAGDQGSWSRTGLGEDEHKIDPTAMETWLSRHCEIDGTFWKQSGLGSRVRASSTFKFELQDGTRGSWDFNADTGVIEVDRDKALVAPEFVSALAQIPKIP